MKRSWHSADTCSSRVELTFITVTGPDAIDRGGALRAAHIAGLAETVAALQISERPSAPLHADAPLHDDVEAIVHLAFLDDLLGIGIVLPAAGAQNLPDLAVREFVEELQLAQQAELFLLIDAVVLRAQFLMHARQFGGKVQTGFVALLRVLLQRHGRHVLELLGNLGTQRMNGRRSREYDLVQELLQVAGAERPRARSAARTSPRPASTDPSGW